MSSCGWVCNAYRLYLSGKRCILPKTIPDDDSDLGATALAAPDHPGAALQALAEQALACAWRTRTAAHVCGRPLRSTAGCWDA